MPHGLVAKTTQEGSDLPCGSGVVHGAGRCQRDIKKCRSRRRLWQLTHMMEGNCQAVAAIAKLNRGFARFYL